MSLELNGFQFWVPGQQLVMLVIVDTRAEKNSYVNYYNPTTEEIIRACNETGIPHEPILNMIAEKRPDVHTLFIDVKKYLEAWTEDLNRAAVPDFCNGSKDCPGTDGKHANDCPKWTEY